MSRQLEQLTEERSERKRQAVLHAVYGGIDSAISAKGLRLAGMSIKLTGGDCLLTLRAANGDGTIVGFIGAGDLPDALAKAVREVHTDQVKWRPSKYSS